MTLTNGTVTVGPYRWILRKESKSGSMLAYARRMYFYDGESSVVGPTGTEEIYDLPIYDLQFNTGEWYDLQGRKQSGKPTRSGVYLNNGKKVIVK